jgi:hypothetical protein
MKPHVDRVRGALIGSLIGFICGTPAWFILSMWTGDVPHAFGIAACIWFGITAWIIVVAEWEGRSGIQRLFHARRRRRELIRAEFAEDEHEPIAH